MARGRRARPLRILGVLFALAIAGAILFFQLNANSLNRISQAEAAITPAPTTAPPANHGWDSTPLGDCSRSSCSASTAATTLHPRHEGATPIPRPPRLGSD